MSNSIKNEKTMSIKFLIAFVITAVAATQVSNFVAVRLYSIDAPYLSALKAAMFTLPLAFVATLFFNLFFGSGHLTFSYSALNTMAIGLAILFGILVHFLIGSSKMNLYEMAGSLLIVMGVALIIIKGR